MKTKYQVGKRNNNYKSFYQMFTCQFTSDIHVISVLIIVLINNAILNPPIDWSDHDLTFIDILTFNFFLINS